MGLFSNDSDDSEYSEERVAELVEAAEGNLEKKHLTKDSGMMLTYLYDGPLIGHIKDSEQPEYIFSDESKGYRITEQDGTERTPHHTNGEGKCYLLVTNQRLLYVAGCESGDETIECTYDEIYDVECSGLNNIQYQTTDGKTYKFPCVDRRTVNKAIEYISERATGTEETTDNGTEEPADSIPSDDAEYDSISEAMEESDAATADTNSTSSEFSGLSNIEASDIKNNNLPDTLEKIDDSIKSGETVHYAYTINAAERGDDHMGGLTTGGCLLATDRRLTAYINETIGSSNISIDYTKIDTVEIEHGAMITKLSVQSTSKTYSFPGFNSIDKSEIHDFADFIRNQASESDNDNGSNSTGDPTEQLRKIKELHDEGIINDEEFESKKEELLDDI